MSDGNDCFGGKSSKMKTEWQLGGEGVTGDAMQ